MEYHFNDLCMPTDHLLADPYAAEYTPQFLMPSQEGEYEVRSSILVDGGDRFGVSAVQFDKYEELIWMGNQGGHVTSYYGPAMQKYTSFQVHETEEVRDIVTTETGIFALTKTSLRHQIRRGIPKHTHRSRNMTDMQCLHQVGPTKLMIGGHQDKLIDLDLTKMVETVIPIPEEGCAVLRSGGGSLLACGSADGSVALRDVRTPEAAEHTFRAHTACLSDLDMQGDLLITCGFTQSPTGVAVAEPYVVVWDVRRLRAGGEAAWPCATAAPPLLLHYLPAFSGRAVALSGDGHVALLHVNSNTSENHSVFQVDTHSSVCSVMDVSATSQALVFGDQAGHLHLFSPQHNHEPVFNNFSRATEFAESPPNIPFAGFSDTFQFSTVPLPPLAPRAKWFNDLPESFFKKGYRKPKPIDPEVLKTMKMQGPIGYAPNPRTGRRNQMPYIDDTLEDLFAAKLTENKFATQPIPKHYQKMDLRFNKHNQNEDAVNNKCGYPGLEAILPNSYCNSMLQVLYYTQPVKSTLLAHTCNKEFCLSCELGFLFRMLDASGGAPCQATNFLRAFRTVPEAAALGLILPDRGPDPRVDLVALIQSWNRFILHQMHYEILETRKKEKELALLANSSPPKPRLANVAPNGVATTQVNGQYTEDYQYAELEFLGPSTEFEQDGDIREDGWHNNLSQEEAQDQHPKVNDELPSQQADREESDISQLFAIGRHQLNRCLKCNKEEERESVVLACALQLGGGGATREEPRGFLELVRASLAPRRATPAWCERCARFTPTAQQGRIIRYGQEPRGFLELVRASLAPRRATPAWCERCARFTPTAQQGRIIRYGQEPRGFLELVRASLAPRRATPAWCERCARFTPTAQQGRIIRYGQEPRGFLELVRASLAPRRATPAWCERCARFTPTAQQGRIIRYGQEPRGFLELVRASLAPRRATPAWCERCARFTPTAQQGRIIRYGQEPRGFLELVRASLAPRRATPAWCERCARFTPTAQQGRIIRLPPILAINCGGITAHEKAYWAKGIQKDAQETSKRGSSGKPCRYGLHCARPGCRFKHPDRPSPSQGSSKSPDSHCVLPHQLLVRLQSDGDVIINDKNDSPSDRDKHKKKQTTTQSEDEYCLSAAVVCVEDNPRNLVAYVQAGRDEDWYMFNDVSITPVTPSEVVQFSAWWKTPCVLFYTATSLKLGEDAS